MWIEIDGINAHYHMSGKGKDVILLHGWGANLQTFAPVHQFLEKHFRVFSVDFPGFGESDLPPEPWDVDRYTEWLKAFIEKNDIKNPILIGHSFGGRVSIRYSAENPVNKVILVDSAGIKPKRKFSYYIKVYTYKAAKQLLNLPILRKYKDQWLTKLKGKMGSADYKNVAGVMQQTLVKVVNEDLRHHLPNIDVPTLLVWGENDEATPVADGKVMEEMIPNAGLVVLKNAGHYAYLDQLNQFLIIIDNFLTNDKEDSPRDD